MGRGTILMISLAVAAGIGLFHVSYRVRTLEHELTRINRQIIQERETIHVLRAEWSYLNEPSRLAELTRRHLELAPLSATQMTRIEDLPLRLPPLLAEAPVPQTSAKNSKHKPTKRALEHDPPTSITELINRVSDQR